MNLDWYGADIFKIKSQVVSCSCSCLQNIICTYKQLDSLGGVVYLTGGLHVIIFENQVVVHITFCRSSDLKQSIFNWSGYFMDHITNQLPFRIRRRQDPKARNSCSELL